MFKFDFNDAAYTLHQYQIPNPFICLTFAQTNNYAGKNDSNVVLDCQWESRGLTQSHFDQASQKVDQAYKHICNDCKHLGQASKYVSQTSHLVKLPCILVALISVLVKNTTNHKSSTLNN